MKRDNAPTVFLMPGELFVAREPTIISTILGSCVSVTMFSPRFKVGGMCHALLPEDEASSGSDPRRFVDNAIVHMVREFHKLGIQRKDILVKLFGGSDVLPTANSESTVGTQNVKKAREIIKREKLRLVAQDVRGEQGRKIFFNTCTGEILLKRVAKQDIRSVS